MMKRFNLAASINPFYGRIGTAVNSRIISSTVISSTIRHQSTYSSSSLVSNRFFSRNPSSTTMTIRRGSGFSSSSSSVAPLVPQLASSSRHNVVTDLVEKVFGKSKSDVELQQLVYDKENVHYTGKIFGVSTDTLFFYTKVGAIVFTVYLVIWTFFAGYNYLMSFSLAAVGKLGFMAGFWTCFILTTTLAQIKRRYTISPNAVYNQAIALALKDKYVREFLGEYPKTGDFRAYHASGGFKLPILRRIRSGSYELADLLGTKPQRLQMMFVLRSGEREALVSCDVRKMHSRLFASSYQFKSLAVHLKDKSTKHAESRVLLGRDEDVIYQGILQL